MTVSEAVGRGFDSRRARHFLSALAVALLLSPAAGAETFRCGSHIASPDMTVEELLEKCGEPAKKSVEQGKDNAREFLKSRPELAREIEDQVRARLLPPKQQRPDLKSVGGTD